MLDASGPIRARVNDADSKPSSRPVLPDSAKASSSTRSMPALSDALKRTGAHTVDTSPPRKDIPFRRKQDDRDFLVKQKLSFRDDGSLGLPLGVIQGQNLALLLESLLVHRSALDAHEERFAVQLLRDQQTAERL